VHQRPTVICLSSQLRLTTCNILQQSLAIGLRQVSPKRDDIQREGGSNPVMPTRCFHQSAFGVASIIVLITLARHVSKKPEIECYGPAQFW